MLRSVALDFTLGLRFFGEVRCDLLGVLVRVGESRVDLGKRQGPTECVAHLLGLVALALELHDLDHPDARFVVTSLASTDPGDLIRDAVRVNNASTQSICDAANIPVVNINGLLLRAHDIGLEVEGVTLSSDSLTEHALVSRMKLPHGTARVIDSPVWPSVRSFLTNVSLALGSLGLTLLVFELAARLDYQRREALGEKTERTRYTDYDRHLGWRKRPLAQVTYRRREYSVEVAINRHGLRDRERTHDNPARAFRILALGDSFLEAYSVPLENALTQVLERSLCESHCRVEVLNGGTGGYSTDQEYLFYVREGARYSPQVVLLFFYHNDVFFNGTEKYFREAKPRLREGDGGELEIVNFPVPPPKPMLTREEQQVRKRYGRSAALGWFKERVKVGVPRIYNELARAGLWSPLGGKPPAPLRVYKRTRNRQRNLAIERGWRVTRMILKHLKCEVERRGTLFALAYIPSRMEVSDRAWELTRLGYGLQDKWDRGLVVERLRRIAESHGIPLLDLTPALREADESLFASPYYVFDGHWNSFGHEIAARAVEDFLRERRWLPPCRPPRERATLP